MNWNDLKYCASVVREGSTLKAASTLKTSQTTVMRRIAALEDVLGYPLFEKRRSGYVPTDALRQLLPALEAVEAAHHAFAHEAENAGRDIRGTIRLTASELLISQFLSGALVIFAQQHPGIDVELHTSDRFLDLTRGEADIAVRAGDPPTESSLFGRRIVADAWSICCSRAYAEKNGVPRTIDDLKHHTVLTVTAGQFESPVTDWVTRNVPRDRIGYRHNSMMTIYMSVKAGLGVSPCPNMLSAVDPDLVRCMPLPVEVGKELWVLVPERLRKAAHVRALADFLAKHLISVIRTAEQRLAERP